MDRRYDAPQFNVRDAREYKSGTVVQADTRVANPITAGDGNWMDNMLAESLGNVSKVLSKAGDFALQDEYLRGAAAASLGQSEAELEGNPLTRDWAKAGYRDTIGKMALADMEASFQADLPLLREKTPEEVQQYLAARRSKMAPVLAGMSREARSATSGQLLLQDRAAIRKYTTERTKFIIDKKSQAVHAQWNTSIAGLNAAQMQVATGELTPADFTEQLRSSAGTVFGSVWMDNSLPLDVKKKLTSEMLQIGLAQDNVALYDYFKTNPVPDGSGGTSSLVSRLDGDDQLKLSNQYRDAMSRTSDARNLARTAQLAALESQIDNDLYTGSYNDMLKMLDPMVLNKSISGERRQGLLNKYLDKQFKNETNSQLADAFMRGDANFILGKNKSITDAVNATEAVMARRGATPQQRLTTWLGAGVAGFDEGFKKAGEFLGVSLRQMVTSTGEVLPQHAETFRTINQALRQAEAQGQTNTRVRLLSGLGEEDRMFAEQIMRRVDTGASLDEAVQRAKEQQAQDSNLSPSIRAARAQATSTALAKSIDALEPRGVLSSIWTWTKAAFGSQSAAADMSLRPTSNVGSRDGWFSDSPTVQFYVEQSRQAVRAEASNVLMLRPSATADEILTVAKSNVAARTISTNQGPLIMPRNVNLQATFGVAPGNQSAIGNAIDGMLKSTVADSRWQLAFDQGRLFAQEFDKAGQRVGNGMFIEGSQIRAKITEDLQKQQAMANNVFGDGRTVSGDGLQIKYDGTNSAGVAGQWMYDFRTNLINHEGIRKQPYRDLSGAKDTAGNDIMTAGVGVSSHNPHYPKLNADGLVTGQEATRSFMGASNDAATAGAIVARDLGKQNQAAFMLLSELAYQSGTAFMSQKNKTGDRYREFGTALKGTDVAAAQEAFKRTAAWYYSRDPGNPDKVTPRQKSYLSLIERSMK